MQNRQVHDQSGPSAMILQQSPPHLYPPNGGSGGYGSPQPYGQLFPLGGPGGPMNMGPPPGPIPPLPPRFEPQYDPALYPQYPPNIIRQTPVPGSGNRNDGGNVSEHREGQQLNGSQRERGGGEMFAAFLEADERSRQMAADRQHQDQLNWPSSTPSPSTPSAASTVQPEAGGNPPTASTTDNWFDMFAGGTASATNPAPEEATSVPWPRMGSFANIGADLVRILNVNTKGNPPPPGGSAITSPPTSSDRPGGSGTTGNGDSAKPKVESQVVEEAEAEKDAEGEDEDVDDKKVNNPTAAMVVDPPQSSSTANEEREVENHSVEVEHDDGDDSTVTKAPPTRGRPRKTLPGSRGKGKAKG